MDKETRTKLEEIVKKGAQKEEINQLLDKLLEQIMSSAEEEK